MIDKLHNVPGDPTLQKALDHIQEKALGSSFGSTTSVSINDIPIGKLHIVDDGTTKRLYIRTDENNMGYINLT